MIKDDAGFVYFTEQDMLEELYKDPTIDLTSLSLFGDFYGHDAFTKYSTACKNHYEEMPDLKIFGSHLNMLTTVEIHEKAQNNWYMPDEYKELDIARWVLDQCDGEAELQRCGDELMLFYERGMENLLRYMKYLVDTMREHKIVWGVGRGSSVASFVLYKIGIHRINSLYYDLDIKEFLR